MRGEAFVQLLLLCYSRRGGKAREGLPALGFLGGGASGGLFGALRRLLRPLLHPALQDQGCGHAVDGSAPFLDGKFGFAQEAVGFGGSQAFVPKVDGELEVFAEILGKCMNLLGLRAFEARHAEGESDDHLFDVIFADDAIEISEIVLFVLAFQGLKALGGNAEGVGYGEANSAGAYIEGEDARDGGVGKHYGIIRLLEP